MKFLTSSVLASAALASLGSAAGPHSDARDATAWKQTPARAAAARVSQRTQYRRLINRASTGWSPPSDLVTPLKEVWDHTLETYNSGDALGFMNYGFDQLEATSGSINYCVRWESDTAVTEAQRAKLATIVNEQYQKWFEWVYGYDNFPYSNISVSVVGWAVKDESLLEGSTSGLEIYTDVDSEGIPQCAEACGRFFHLDGDYSGCAAGEAKHYDQSLWITDDFEGGTGGDWGQRIGTDYVLQNLETDSMHILLHEMGHTFGLDDFYDWTPTGVTEFIMNAGSSTVVTDFDGWMLRNWWYELSQERGWTS